MVKHLLRVAGDVSVDLEVTYNQDEQGDRCKRGQTPTQQRVCYTGTFVCCLMNTSCTSSEYPHLPKPKIGRLQTKAGYSHVKTNMAAVFFGV